MKRLALALTLALTLAACGIKGDLDRPSDIKKQEKNEKSGGLF